MKRLRLICLLVVSMSLIFQFSSCSSLRKTSSLPGADIDRPLPDLPSTLPGALDARERLPVADMPDDQHIPYITYRKTSCYGNCPAFFVQFFADGTVEYHGSANINRLGSASGTFATEQLQRIIEKSREQNITRLATLYPDFPFKNEYLSSTVISIRLRPWQFHTYTWWFNEPAELRLLESSILSLLESVEWNNQ